MINSVNDIRAFTVVLNKNPEDCLISTKKIRKCVEKDKELFPNFQIYTLKDEIVQEALKKYERYISLISPIFLSFISDVVRIYILANTDKNLYLDVDVYIYDLEAFIKNFNEELEKKDRTLFANGAFYLIYKGESDKETLNLVLDYYNTATEVLHDNLVIKKKALYDSDCNLYFKGFFHYSSFLLKNKQIIACVSNNIKIQSEINKMPINLVFLCPTIDSKKNNTKDYIPWSYIYDSPEEYMEEVFKENRLDSVPALIKLNL